MEELKPRHRIEASRLLKTWWINIINIASLILTWGERVLHEGRLRNGIWSDWSRSFSCRPAQFLTPETEQEICDIVRRATKVRVVGAGHSFNAAVLSDHTVI